MNETENSEGKDYMFRVNYRDGQGFVEYFLTGGTSLILEMPRESVGFKGKHERENGWSAVWQHVDDQ